MACFYMATAQERKEVEELVQPLLNELPPPTGRSFLYRQVAIDCHHFTGTCGLHMHSFISELRLAIRDSRWQQVSDYHHFFQERMNNDQL